MPDKSVGITAAGNLSVRKMAKTDRAGLYTAAVMGHVLVTIREAFAVAPNLDQARVVVMRPATLDAYGKPTLECLLAGRWTRPALTHVAWSHADAPTITTQTAAELLINRRASKELRPLDLSNEPALSDLLCHVDVDDLRHTR